MLLFGVYLLINTFGKLIISIIKMSYTNILLEIMKN